MTKIVKFYPLNAAESPDAVLEQAVGTYAEVLVLGYDKQGDLEVRASTNWKTADILFAVERFKLKLIRGDYFKDDEGDSK